MSTKSVGASFRCARRRLYSRLPLVSRQRRERDPLCNVCVLNIMILRATGSPNQLKSQKNEKNMRILRRNSWKNRVDPLRGGRGMWRRVWNQPLPVRPVPGRVWWIPAVRTRKRMGTGRNSHPPQLTVPPDLNDKRPNDKNTPSRYADDDGGPQLALAVFAIVRVHIGAREASRRTVAIFHGTNVTQHRIPVPTVRAIALVAPSARESGPKQARERSGHFLRHRFFCGRELERFLASWLGRGTHTLRAISVVQVDLPGAPLLD